jgi:glycosyltransferase involved in cell wall biosynthesis
MKILQVIHGFPPHDNAGAEVYTYNLSREQAKRNEVYVFHRVSDPTQKEYKTISIKFDGLNICTINNTFRYCESFEKRYRNDIISKKFGDFLDKIKPDIIHVGHVIFLSTSLIGEAKKRKIPIVFTLHDFWLFCPLGQLLKPDLSLCQGPKDSECVKCLAPKIAIKGGVKKAVEIMKRRFPDFQNRTKLVNFFLNIHHQYVKAFFFFQKHPESEIQKRASHIKKMCSIVDFFIAPSHFLLEKFIQFGIPRAKIAYLDNGFDTSLFNDFSKVPSERIRFGFTGTFIPSKGLHVLLEAFNHLKNENTELRIHGKFAPYHAGFETYPEQLRLLGERDNILWLGEYDNKDIAKILAEIDILVIPSIWYENSPLVIHEAFLAQIPVITSNIGGMAELVHDRVNGLHFKVGSSRDLTKKMKMVLDNPNLIVRMSENLDDVIPIEDHALEIEAIYRSLANKNIEN